MKILIPRCDGCPKKADCNLRTDIKQGADKLLKGVTVSFNCNVYKELFSYGDEVMVQLLNGRRKETYKDENGKWQSQYINYGDPVQGVVIGQPIGSKKYFTIALLKPEYVRKHKQLQYIKVMAFQITKIGRYSGKDFWTKCLYDEVNNPTENLPPETSED